MFLHREGVICLYRAAVVTVSDRCFRGERVDEGGPLVEKILMQGGFDVCESALVWDEQGDIEAVLCQIAASAKVEFIVTTVGTGFAPRDVTSVATPAFC